MIYVTGYHPDKSITILNLYDQKNRYWKIWLCQDFGDKLPDNITLKNAVILITYVIKDGDRFYPQPFLEKTLHDE